MSIVAYMRFSARLIRATKVNLPEVKIGPFDMDVKLSWENNAEKWCLTARSGFVIPDAEYPGGNDTLFNSVSTPVAVAVGVAVVVPFADEPSLVNGIPPEQPASTTTMTNIIVDDGRSFIVLFRERKLLTIGIHLQGRTRISGFRGRTASVPVTVLDNFCCFYLFLGCLYRQTVDILAVRVNTLTNCRGLWSQH